MTDGEVAIPPDEDPAMPELWQWTLHRLIRMHRVPPGYRDRLQVGRVSLSLSDCGKMCGPSFPHRGYAVEWCEKCFPTGAPNVQGTL